MQSYAILCNLMQSYAILGNLRAELMPCTIMGEVSGILHSSTDSESLIYTKFTELHSSLPYLMSSVLQTSQNCRISTMQDSSLVVLSSHSSNTPNPDLHKLTELT
eukprot:Lithocolla_globosa_v1_NODE_2087_length_2166_cov_20.599057.p2 type:complete len:105 gc:universal NODE_2087_length_2166_cov_20.599057:559-873(+)